MKKLRVLLVDDEIMIREGFKKLFDWEAHDCEVWVKPPTVWKHWRKSIASSRISPLWTLISPL